MKTSIIAMAGLVMLGAGIGTGLIIGARRSEKMADTPRSDQETRTPEPRAQRPAPNVDPSPRVPEKPVTAGLDEAQELWRLMVAEETSDGATLRRKESLKREELRKLRPELAEFFIGKYRELVDSMKVDRQYALEMAIACGGEKTAAFIKELWDTPVDAQQEWMLRWMLADMISRGHLMKRPRELPIDPSLMNQARLLVDSGPVADRRLAIAILGFTDPAVAVPILTDRFRRDTNPLVRESAVRELARLGNSETLALLRGERDSNTTAVFTGYVQPQAVRGGPPVRSIDARGYLRTIDDAIEELEERLAPK